VILVWVMSLSIMSPWLFYYKQIHEYHKQQLFYFCVQDWPIKNGESVFFLVVFIICYVVPLVMIIGCYSMIALRVSTRNAPGIFRYSNIIQKSKVRVIKMLALIVVLFGLSWLPLYAIFLILQFNPPDPHSRQLDLLVNVFAPIAHWLGMSNSGMNPIIYCFFSKTIRKRTVAMLACSTATNLHRPHRHFSSTKLMSSVDYTNGQITLRLNKPQLKSNILRKGHGHFICESTFYD